MNWLERFEAVMGYRAEAPDPLEETICRWDRQCRWKRRDAFEGAVIFGANGSGKTSGGGEKILRGLMEAGFGGLVLSVKGDEWQTCCELAELTGRTHDLVRFTRYPKGHCCYNPLEGETVTENAVQLLLTLVALGTVGQRAKDDDGFWKDELQKLLRHAIELLFAAGEHVDLYRLEKLISSTARTLPDVEAKSWQAGSLCWALLEKVRTERGGNFDMNMERCRDFFLKQLPGLSDKTRSIIFSMATGTLDTFLRDPLYSLLSARSTVTPQDAIERGRIIVVDVPVLVEKEIGLLVNRVWKYCFQRAVNARKGGRDVFIFGDEAQYFLTPADQEFQTTTRSLRCACVYLTQNLPNLYAKLGEHVTMALLGVLATKVFHQNACVVTNKWAAETIGHTRQVRSTESTGTSTQGGGIFGSQNQSRSTSDAVVYDYAVRPEAFTGLKRGGPANGFIVEGYLYQAGAKFPTSGKRWLRTQFRQRKKG